MDREAWQAAVHGAAKSQARLSELTQSPSPSFFPSLPSFILSLKDALIGLRVRTMGGHKHMWTLGEC